MENGSSDALVPDGWKIGSEDSALFQCLLEDHCVDDDVANGRKLNSAKHLFQTVGKLILKTFLLEKLNGDDDGDVPNGWIADLKHFSESHYSSLSGGRSAKVWFGSMDNGCERGKADLITEF